MEHLANLAIFIGAYINWIILFLAVVTIGGFLWTYFKVKTLREKMDEDRKKSGGRKEYTEGGIKMDADVYTWEDNLVYMEKFNKVLLTYSVFEQFVPLFPLFGILGTVSGLIQQLSNSEQLRRALETSMSTTFLGLIAAIVLKIMDALLVSKAVDERAMYFDAFEQNYQMVKDKHSQEVEADRRG